jgi:uncharacterized protein YbaP (TraB family)
MLLCYTNLSGQTVLSNKPNTLVWEITDKSKTQHKSYIIGSNHLYGEKLLNSLMGLKELIHKSDIVISESLTKSKEERELIYNQRTPYTSLFTNRETAVIDSFLTTHQIAKVRELDSAHFPINRLLFIIASELMAENNSDLQNLTVAMDNVIIEWAKNANIPLAGLDDGIAIDKDVLSLGIEELQIADAIRSLVISPSLLKSKDSLNSSSERYAGMNVDYKFNSEPPYIQNTSLHYLLIERNKYWMPRLIQYLSSKNCFIVVGIDHLKYKDGLLVSLSRLGFNIRPVNISLDM